MLEMVGVMMISLFTIQQDTTLMAATTLKSKQNIQIVLVHIPCLEMIFMKVHLTKLIMGLIFKIVTPHFDYEKAKNKLNL